MRFGGLGGVDRVFLGSFEGFFSSGQVSGKALWVKLRAEGFAVVKRCKVAGDISDCIGIFRFGLIEERHGSFAQGFFG